MTTRFRIVHGYPLTVSAAADLKMTFDVVVFRIVFSHPERVSPPTYSLCKMKALFFMMA